MSFKDILFILLVIIIWGSNFVVIKIGVMELEPLLILGLRFLVAGLIFIPFMKWPGWKQASLVMLAGLMMGPLHQGLLYFALTEVDAGVTSILMKSNILMVTFIGWIFLKEHVGLRTWLGIFTGLLGIFIIFGGPSFDISSFNLILIFSSALFLSITYVLQKQIGNVHAATYIALMSLPNALPIFISSYAIEGTQWVDNIDEINWGIVLSVVFYQGIILSLSHMLWQRLMAKNDVSQIVPWTLLVPIFAVISSILFMGEIITIYTITGGLITISGVAIVTFRRIQKKY